MKNQVTMHSSAAEYLTYVASVGEAAEQFEIRYEDENIWLTQKMLARLYGVETPTINYHLKKVFADAELSEESVIRKFRITAADGKKYQAMHYGIQAVIAVGFKVNSERAVQFRKWVNAIAREYTIKGWVMDDERLKQGTFLSDKYFEEQLERVREIRASERRFYQKVTDIYATAVDYDRTAAATRRFYATVQNKMHFAVHGRTAAELIVDRADAGKPHMGLTTWRDAPDGKIIRSDLSVAKNYLNADEMAQLNRLVTACLDFAENMALRKIPLTMADWEARLNSFIEMHCHPIKTRGPVFAMASVFAPERLRRDRPGAMDHKFHLAFRQMKHHCIAPYGRANCNPARGDGAQATGSLTRGTPGTLTNPR